MVMDAEEYEAWYQTPRGKWISKTEFNLLYSMMRPKKGETLLDVGCGTGHFSRLFAEQGLQVTGLDPDRSMLEYAKLQNHHLDYRYGSATELPFENNTFERSMAITSLCFVEPASKALQEMWRVSRQSLTLGLLNRKSLLYREKYNKSAYAGARWDTWEDAQKWISELAPPAGYLTYKTAVFIPSGSRMAKLVEHLMPKTIPFGSFLAVHFKKIYFAGSDDA